jgi:uncharacterized protein (TIGR03435 family)
MRFLLLACFSLAFGQTPGDLNFEVASVKQTSPPQPGSFVFFGPPRGGPGTSDPVQITWTNATLRNILMTAYGVQTFLLTAPDWLVTESYDIVAKVPAGATKQQVNIMWQNLLKERFGVVLHHELKEMQVQVMTVAKGGLKMKETSLPTDAEPFTAPPPPNPAKGGLPEMNGSGMIVSISLSGNNPIARAVAKGLTSSEIAGKFSGMLRQPVVDKTGLTTRFDFNLEFSPDLNGIPLAPGGRGQAPSAAPLAASEPGSSIPAAIEKQLGLKLTGSKDKLDVIVVDSANKIPTEN